jgi:hypothetical protein
MAALASLERAGNASVVHVVARLAAAGGDAEVRSSALRVLVRSGGRSAIESLVAIAEDPHRTADVVEGLAAVGASDVPWVAGALATDDTAVRCAVIEALGRMPYDSASAALASALHHTDEATRAAATYALARRDLRAARATGAAADVG